MASDSTGLTRCCSTGTLGSCSVCVVSLSLSLSRADRTARRWWTGTSRGRVEVSDCDIVGVLFMEMLIFFIFIKFFFSLRCSFNVSLFVGG
jgi:hypothetical protein